MIVPDRRHWILDPPLHRLGEKAMGRTGYKGNLETIAQTMFIIELHSDSALEDWVCDFCSAPILTALGESPFPVPMWGSNALCLDHFNKFSGPIDPQGLDHLIGDVYLKLTEFEVRSMELHEIAFHPEYEARKGYGLGPWPLNFCSCPFCSEILGDWRDSFRIALRDDPRFQKEPARNNPGLS